LRVLLGRAALNQGVGGRQVMIGQLQHLLEMAARPNIEIRIVPDDRGWHPGLEGDFTLIESSRATAVNNSSTTTASIIFVGNRRTVLMLHEDGDVDTYKRAVNRIVEITLQPDVSLNFIADLCNRMEKRRGN
jgi:hypothetical protein